MRTVLLFDPAGNVINDATSAQFKNLAAGDFNSDDILHASEIAFVTDDVRAVSAQLKDIAGVPSTAAAMRTSPPLATSTACCS